MHATVIEMILFNVATTLEPLKALAANDGRRNRRVAGQMIDVPMSALVPPEMPRDTGA